MAPQAALDTLFRSLIASNPSQQHLATIATKLLMANPRGKDIRRVRNKLGRRKELSAFLDYATSNWFLHNSRVSTRNEELQEVFQWFEQRKECAHHWTERIYVFDVGVIDSIQPENELFACENLPLRPTVRKRCNSVRRVILH